MIPHYGQKLLQNSTNQKSFIKWKVYQLKIYNELIWEIKIVKPGSFKPCCGVNVLEFGFLAD